MPDDAAVGFAYTGAGSSTVILLFAAMPVDVKVIRLIGGIGVLLPFGLAAAGLLHTVLLGTEMNCVYESALLCRVAAFGFAGLNVANFGCSFFAATTLRLRPGAPRVRMAALWPWLRETKRLNPWLSAVALLLLLPVVWALAQEEESFTLPPRVALQR